MPIKVQKKSGQIEDFNRSKIINGLIKSGATAEEAEGITKQIEVWVPTAAANGLISSAAIRVKLLDLLQTTNPNAAKAFETYQKPVQAPV